MERVYAAAALLPTAEAMARLEAERVPCGVLTAPAELPDDPHARGHRAVRASSTIRSPVGCDCPATRPGSRAHAGGDPADPLPALGQHTDEILTELGLADRIADLRAGAAVA